ncbi:MAG TPA: flagellar biosynthetic protein FliR [Devosiaceae bacterium]
MTIGLNWLPDTAFLYMIVFARVGCMLMLLPALGESTIPANMRLAFAVMFTLVLLPLLRDHLPPLPTEFMSIVALLFHELIIGLLLGGLMRIFVMAAQVAGAIIAFQIGLSSAMMADPTQGGVQGVVVSTFLSFLGVTLIFATDLHHLALAAIYDSYMIFVPTDPLMFGDAAQTAIRAVSGAFSVGIQMSAPFIVFGLIFNLGMGILSRLMPQLQVFFLAMPATIGVGLILMALLLTMMMGWYLNHFEAELANLRV